MFQVRFRREIDLAPLAIHCAELAPNIRQDRAQTRGGIVVHITPLENSGQKCALPKVRASAQGDKSRHILVNAPKAVGHP